MTGVLAGLLAAALAAGGASLDGVRPVPQLGLFLALQAASLAGAALGAAQASLRMRSAVQRWGLVLAVLIGWRLAYFPIMVFSGHLASIAEWLEIALGVAVFVYPFFLVSVALLHAAAALAIGFALRPPHKLVYAVVLPAFAVATAVSFSTAEDLHPLPDRSWRLAGPIPERQLAEANPYLPALTAPGYTPHQRVMLLAAGLTYETIPGSPWATAVKAVLESLFHQNPHASTADRVREHYLAYHSAHALIGCTRSFSGCFGAEEPAREGSALAPR